MQSEIENAKLKIEKGSARRLSIFNFQFSVRLARRHD